ncbi:MAG: hypothetical protein AAGA40_17945 [Cyanobacteria bacterium P01_E01_bin.45]
MSRNHPQSTWIFKENLYPWLKYVALCCGYDFDDGDRAAFEHGIRSTDVESNCWFDYSFPGHETCQIYLALDPGSSVVFVGGEFPDSLQQQVDVLTDIAQLYWLQRMRP